MKKAILFLVALILLSFITNAGVGDFKECKVNHPLTAYSLYRVKDQTSKSEFVQARSYFIKANLFVASATESGFSMGIVAKSNQASLCAKLVKLTPSLKTPFLISIRSRNYKSLIPISGRSNNGYYNYLPVLCH